MPFWSGVTEAGQLDLAGLRAGPLHVHDPWLLETFENKTKESISGLGHLVILGEIWVKKDLKEIILDVQ